MSYSLLVLTLAATLIQATTPASRPAEDAFAAAVSADDLKRYVRELVAFGPRMSGTPSNEKSAAYLSAFFKKQGLKVVVQEDAPALAHWEQSWTVALEDGAVIESAYPFGFSPATRGVDRKAPAGRGPRQRRRRSKNGKDA